MSTLQEIDAAVFLKDLAREAVRTLEVVEPGINFTQQGDKVVYDVDAAILAVYCREYPNEPVILTWWC